MIVSWLPSNALSDDDEPDLQQIFVEEACQHRSNQKKLLKLNEAKLKYTPKFRKILVSGLLKEFNQWHIDNQRNIDSSGHPNSAMLLDINEICGMYL